MVCVPMVYLFFSTVVHLYCIIIAILYVSVRLKGSYLGL